MATPPILTLSDIHLTFGGDPVFAGLSLSIHDGDRMCLVGRNGSGKSTLMKVMAKLIEPDNGDRFLRPGKAVGYMDQHPDLAAYPTLGDYARSDLLETDFYKVEIVAEGLKLDLDRTPATASGGERRRAALCKIVAEEPDLMLLDEPTNHLDIQAIEWLEDHLKQTNQAFVLISHDRAFLRSLTRGTLWVDRGVVRNNPKGFEAFEDWRDTVFEEEDQQRHKLNRLIKAEARWAVEGISARRKRNQGRVRRLADLRDQRAGQITRKGAAAMVLDSGQKSSKLVLEALDISKQFGDRTIIRDFSLKVTRGQRIALVGPNGVGKTTVLNMLTGELAPDTGSVRMGQKLLPAIFDQNRSALRPEMSLWDSLTEDPELGVSGKNDQIMVRGMPRHVVGYLKEYLFDENQARGPVSVLSGGEKARLLLARIMAKESNLLILDEPTNDLDVETLDLMQEILDGYDGTVLLVSHDRDFLDRIATTTIALEGDGNATVYAGGWSDYQSQRRAVAKAEKAKKKKQKQEPVAQKSTPIDAKLSFTEAHRLKILPAEIERLQAEIAKLETFLSDPELFVKEPLKFQKATDGLVERNTALQNAEDEWLELSMRAEEA
ncbi:UNVERIFIED_CONTAM: hypothetical protein GTU68_032558 [Idotea baltica]|nr:hypothetical protein [Idotea baltica]